MARAVSITVVCSLGASPSNSDFSQAFSLVEGIDVESGARIVVADDRGFAIGSRTRLVDHLTATTLAGDARAALEPDDGAERIALFWEERAQRARAQGLVTTSSALMRLPLHVVCADDVLRWLDHGNSPRAGPRPGPEPTAR